jgi:hypothetical protein
MAASAVALGVSLWLPWYELPEPSGGIDYTAWETFAVTDVILFALVIGTVLAVLRTADKRSASEGLFGEGLVTLPAVIVSVIVLIRFLNIPGDFEPVKDVVSRGVGAWIGLFATFGILVGDLLAMRNEWVGSRPVPEIETLPAPPKGSAPA